MAETCWSPHWLCRFPSGLPSGPYNRLVLQTSLSVIFAMCTGLVAYKQADKVEKVRRYTITTAAAVITGVIAFYLLGRSPVPSSSSF